MRIVMISPYPPARDGIGDYSARLAAELTAAGHEVRVVAARPGADGSRPEAPWVLPASQRARSRLADAVGDYGPDVVHLQFAVAAFGTRTRAALDLAARVRAAGARLVVTCHEATRDTDSLRAAGRALYARVTREADVLVAHTAAARDVLLFLAGDAVPVRVIPHPRVELPAPTASVEELRDRHHLGGDRVLLAFGFVHVDKGLGDLVEALAILRENRGHEVADVRLAVAGEVRARRGPFRIFEVRDRVHLRSVRHQVRRRGLAGSVLFTGYVPSGEVRPWFDLAEAAVLPYRRIEQSGVASIAAALGVPTVASTAGGLADEIATPWRVGPRAPEQLADELGRLIDTPPARRGAPGVASGASIREVARATLQVYGAEEVARAGT